jgi:2-dehydropantoate 2-reductase
VACLQNGLCEERIAPIVGADRVVGVVVGWGGTSPSPGVFERTAHGGFTLGWLGESRHGERLAELASILASVGPVETTRNLSGKRWSKLAINCAITSLGAVGGLRLGALIRHAFVRRFALEVMTEVVKVARAEGVSLEKVSGTLDLNWIALRSSETTPALVAKHGVLWGVGLKYRRMKSSMLSAVERGRPPAVDFLNGEVCVRAARHGIAVPFNERLRSLVWDVASRRVPPSLDLIRSARETSSAEAEVFSPADVAPLTQIDLDAS